MNMQSTQQAWLGSKPALAQTGDYRERWLDDIQSYTVLMKEANEVYDQQAKMMKQIDDLIVNPSESNLKHAKLAQIKESLEWLDTRSVELTRELDEIEVRVLTYDPQEKEEVTLMLSFIASVLSSGHKIDDCYLSDVLEHCSQTLLAAA